MVSKVDCRVLFECCLPQTSFGFIASQLLLGLFNSYSGQHSIQPDVDFVVQNVTVQSVACATLVNVGSQLAASNHPGLASVLFGGSSVFGFLIYRGFKRVRRIDKFEKNIRG